MENELREERLRKLNSIISAGIDPYPAESERTHPNNVFLENFDNFLTSGDRAVLAGRIMSWRGQGGIIFVDIFDGIAKVQVLLKKDNLSNEAPGQSFEFFNDVVSISDFVEFYGAAFRTKRGENSLEASSFRILTKSLRQVPDQHDGLSDEDERYRKRYLDILLRPEARELVERKAKFWGSIRRFMLGRGFLEVETPILETKTGGAEARPFITHHNALDLEVYLRISVELWHKKLMVAGLPKTFEIGRVFRNEGMSYEHAQDYSHFEFYEAYADGRAGVQFLIDMYRQVAFDTFGTYKFKIGQFDIDLESEWARIDFNDLMMKNYDFDPRTVELRQLLPILASQDIEIDSSTGLGRAVDILWKKVRKAVGGPAIMTGIPVYLEPLAKRNPGDSRVVDRYQILLGGSEVGKAFNELNNPLDQRERFEMQQALRDRGDEEAQMADFDYVEAMEYGMPPMFGFGVSERLFSFLAGKSLRECQTFPLMRPK